VLDISNLEQDLDTAYFSEDKKVIFATPYNITSANSIRNKQSFVLDLGFTRYIISSKSLIIRLVIILVLLFGEITLLYTLKV
jgi:hypothetical protein